MIDIGIDSFAATIPHPATGRTLPPPDRMEKLLAEVEVADSARFALRHTNGDGRADKNSLIGEPCPSSVRSHTAPS